MVRIKCPSCGAVQDVEDSLRGQVGKCGACGRVLRVPAASAPPHVPEELDTAIRPDLPGTGTGPHSVSPAGAGGPENRSAVSATGGMKDPAGWGGTTFLEGAVAEVRSVEKKRGRRKAKGRGERRAHSFGGMLRDWTGAFGVFGWILVGLAGLWLGSLAIVRAFP